MYRKLFRLFTTTSDTQYTSILKEVEAKVYQTFYDHSQISQIDRNQNLQDYNFDSLKKIELIVSLEQKFCIDIQDDEVLKIQTINDCIVIFNKYMVEKLNRDKLILFNLDEKQIK